MEASNRATLDDPPTPEATVTPAPCGTCVRLATDTSAKGVPGSFLFVILAVAVLVSACGHVRKNSPAALETAQLTLLCTFNGGNDPLPGAAVWLAHPSVGVQRVGEADASGVFSFPLTDLARAKGGFVIVCSEGFYCAALQIDDWRLSKRDTGFVDIVILTPMAFL